MTAGSDIWSAFICSSALEQALQGVSFKQLQALIFGAIRKDFFFIYSVINKEQTCACGGAFDNWNSEEKM